MSGTLDRRSLAWMTSDAPCLAHPALFLRPDPAATAFAKELCGDCPVQKQCLEHAIQHEERGIWGGTTTLQRAQLRRWKTT